LLWWTDPLRVPPLVTTSPTGTALDDAGILGRPGTRVLFGGGQIDSDERSGSRITLGYWFTPCQTCGIEANYLALDSQDTNFRASSQGDPILARPFFDLDEGGERAQMVAFPGALAGTVTVDAESDFQTSEVLLRKVLCCECDYRIDLLAGYRFARLDDKLRIGESLRSLNIANPGMTVELFDLFDTENQFHGGQIGITSQMRRCNWTLELLAKLALGNTHTEVLIDGSTTVRNPSGSTATGVGGLLAQRSNIGHYENDQFAVMPELGVRLGYDFCCRWRATFGYTLLYWSQVARPGDQIVRDLYPAILPPALNDAARPAFSLVTTDFWAQGLNFGLEYQF
jgi:hypothetical protein